MRTNKQTKKLSLSKEQARFLSFFVGTKSAYRRDAFERDQKWGSSKFTDRTYDELQSELLALGALKANKAGAISCALSETEYTLATKQPTLPEAESTLRCLMADVHELQAQRDALPAASWPEPAHFKAKSLSENIAYKNEQIKAQHDVIRALKERE